MDLKTLLLSNLKKKSISNVRLSECSDARYIQPRRVFFSENGVEKSWEVVGAYDSVATLIYHREKESFVLVRQFRPAVFLKKQGFGVGDFLESSLVLEENEFDGYTYELCAGIIDKKKSVAEIAAEEILEECGYKVSIDRLEKITSFYTSVGFAGSRQCMFFVELGEEDRVSEGGGIELEDIEVIYLPKKLALEFIYNESYPKTSGVLFAILWYFSNQ